MLSSSVAAAPPVSAAAPFAKSAGVAFDELRGRSDSQARRPLRLGIVRRPAEEVVQSSKLAEERPDVPEVVRIVDPECGRRSVMSSPRVESFDFLERRDEHSEMLDSLSLVTDGLPKTRRWERAAILHTV